LRLEIRITSALTCSISQRLRRWLKKIHKIIPLLPSKRSLPINRSINCKIQWINHQNALSRCNPKSLLFLTGIQLWSSVSCTLKSSESWSAVGTHMALGSAQTYYLTYLRDQEQPNIKAAPWHDRSYTIIICYTKTLRESTQTHSFATRACP
jgi:hypothetical protein